MSAQIISESLTAFFRHCLGHALNFTVGDMVKNIRFLRGNMDTSYKIPNHFNKLPKRGSIPKKIREDLALQYLDFLVFCPTRWTVCGKF